MLHFYCSYFAFNSCYHRMIKLSTMHFEVPFCPNEQNANLYISRVFFFSSQIQRFLTLASLYNDIRMYRKAAFYSRIAAMQCVSGSNQHPSWSSCYQLLLQALPGYQLSLDPKDMHEG